MESMPIFRIFCRLLEFLWNTTQILRGYCSIEIEEIKSLFSHLFKKLAYTEQIITFLIQY